MLRGTFLMCDIHEFMSYFIQNNFVKINLKKKFSVKPFFLQKNSNFCSAFAEQNHNFSYVKIFHINIKIIHSPPPEKLYIKEKNRLFL